jgi:hypothetical protein
LLLPCFSYLSLTAELWWLNAYEFMYVFSVPQRHKVHREINKFSLSPYSPFPLKIVHGFNGFYRFFKYFFIFYLRYMVSRLDYLKISSCRLFWQHFFVLRTGFRSVYLTGVLKTTNNIPTFYYLISTFLYLPPIFCLLTSFT